jgi:hypothetical protein
MIGAIQDFYFNPRMDVSGSHRRPILQHRLGGLFEFDGKRFHRYGSAGANKRFSFKLFRLFISLSRYYSPRRHHISG